MYTTFLHISEGTLLQGDASAIEKSKDNPLTCIVRVGKSLLVVSPTIAKLSTAEQIEYAEIILLDN